MKWLLDYVFACELTVSTETTCNLNVIITTLIKALLSLLLVRDEFVKAFLDCGALEVEAFLGHG